ncbi:MAG: hypothetical protein A2Y12_14365 [Planctomycetes bacterium GWF2_42_9]|nr:MAG: hypothetical protein A2Y12_14365 [Planctomycetes bacterium GWF2_42_9]
MNKAIFLDRDGTIIEERGYIKNADEVIFIDNVFKALQMLQKHYKLFIVTNQSGIGKNIITAQDVDNINRYILTAMREQNIIITDIYVCPHKRDAQCECIKPKPFFLHKAAAAYNIDLKKSFSIGDHPHDVELAQNVGGKGIYLLTGHGTKHLGEIQSKAIVFSDIDSAADWIVKNNNTFY